MKFGVITVSYSGHDSCTSVSVKDGRGTWPGAEGDEVSKVVAGLPAALILILTFPVSGRLRAPRNVGGSSPQTGQGPWDGPSLLPVLSHLCFSPGNEERGGREVF